MAEAFVHLRASSQYSLLYSAARADELAQAARAQGMSALGITERGGLYGPVSVYQALKSENVAPVLGAVFSVVRERAGGIRREAPVALPVLALGARGFEALCQLSTEAALSSRDSERVITWEELFAHAADLLCLTGDDDGPLGRALREPDRGEGLAARMLGRLREVFADRLYVELCDQGTPTDHERNRILARLAKAQQVPIVATSVIRHLAPDDVRTVDMLHAIGQGLTLAEAVAVRDAHARYHFVSRAEMAQRFRDLPEALALTQEVAERARIELPVGALHMPRFPLPQGVLESDYLRQVALEGLRLRRPSASRVYAERLAYELQVIEQMGFAGYFLIVWDFMKFAHDQGISTGPGRGSAAGSLVAYALAITDVDPIAYDLLFERFLNAERVSWPDIDIDFEAERRQEVIAYVARRYGDRRVAQIGTLGTFAARAAVRDVGRVLQTPAAQIEALVRTLPAGSSATLSEAIAQAPELQAVLQKAPGLHRVIEAAEAIAGLPRHASIHAAGVVIATEDLTTWTPLMPGTEETFATQYSMEDIEALGLLKMDFLGLRTLTICDRTVAYVKHVRGVEPAYDEAEFDAATKALLASGDTDGCFQLEGTGVKHVLQALCPESLEDVIAVISLYRPGPMEQIGTYIAARRGQVEPKYEPPVLKPILEKTYGILIYQEQIMQIASVMAGFTLGQADVLRRAVAKKKREDLAQARDAFVSGCLKMGHEASVAHEVYDLIVRFADYGFNRSHAAAYAVLAYRTAYLKANYRAEFMAALIADSASRPDKVAQYALACTRAGILVKAPDVNRSEGDAIPETGTDGALSIRLGLFSVKHVGVGAVARLVEERKQHGPFRSLADLCARVDSRALTKRVLESLIKAGACDGWELSRQTLLKQLDALGKNDRPQTAGESGGRNSRQLSLLEGTERKASEDVEVRDDAERLQGDDDAEAMRQQDEWERELIGFVVSRQPYAHLQKWREALAVVPLAQIVQGAVSTTGGDRLHHLVADVAGLRTVKTKKGEAMGFLTLEDDSGRMEVVLFPSVYRNLDPMPKVGESLSVHARLDPGGN
ncbi:MAG: DNA polymerase III subunit alpha [Firmicutes bacterium]|nr:DNA polymerase III subunit alpha [Bacillota bacterium]